MPIDTNSSSILLKYWEILDTRMVKSRICSRRQELYLEIKSEMAKSNGSQTYPICECVVDHPLRIVRIIRILFVISWHESDSHSPSTVRHYCAFSGVESANLAFHLSETCCDAGSKSIDESTRILVLPRIVMRCAEKDIELKLNSIKGPLTDFSPLRKFSWRVLDNPTGLPDLTSVSVVNIWIGNAETSIMGRTT